MKTLSSPESIKNQSVLLVQLKHLKEKLHFLCNRGFVKCCSVTFGVQDLNTRLLEFLNKPAET